MTPKQIKGEIPADDLRKDIWAMYDTMLAAALTNTAFMVLDRPNPISGMHAFGPVLDERFSSYVGRRAIAQAHGMTAGELAKMFVGEGWIREATNGSELALEVVKMDGWRREMMWVDTGLPWVMPSPSTLGYSSTSGLRNGGYLDAD